MASEIVDIRRFEADQFTPLLRSEAQDWGRRLHWDYAPAARVISTCLAAKRLTGYALVNDGHIEGYSFYVCEGEKGLIGNCYVADATIAADDVSRLLERVLETLLASPGLRRVEAQLPHFSGTALEPCFHEHGFRTYVRRFMLLGLDSYRAQGAGPGSVPEVLRSGEFRIEPWERRHDRQAAHLIYHTYRGHVDAAINDQYASPEGATRLIENIAELRGCGEPVPRASLVALHSPTRKLAGLVALTAVQRETAHIPQVAVAREFQSRGLGAALLSLAFHQAAQRGYREVSLTVTDLNRGAIRFYQRLGFETFRTFGAFVWSGT